MTESTKELVTDFRDSDVGKDGDLLIDGRGRSFLVLLFLSRMKCVRKIDRGRNYVLCGLQGGIGGVLTFAFLTRRATRGKRARGQSDEVSESLRVCLTDGGGGSAAVLFSTGDGGEAGRDARGFDSFTARGFDSFTARGFDSFTLERITISSDESLSG